MEKKYAINLLKGGPDYAKTYENFFKIPFVMLSVAKRFSGKTCSLTQFLHILHKMGKLDRLILISPTFENNRHYFKGLPLDEVNDIIQPTLDASDIVMRKLEEEATEYDDYKESLQKWNQLQYELKNNKKHIEEIDNDLLLHFFGENFNTTYQKPIPKYSHNNKPIVVAMFDDCQNTPAFSPKSSISYLTIKSRHIGQTKTDGSIGCNLIYAVQNYTSNSFGLPKSVRGNINILCVFKNKNQKELNIIADECCGEISIVNFLRLHNEATSKSDFGFLTIDFNKKSNHPSMFRKCWNKWLMP